MEVMATISHGSSVVEIESGWVSVERTGEGPDLLLLHSLLTDRRAFEPIVESLSKTRTVNLIDLPGFGETTLVDPTIDAQSEVIGSLLTVADYDPATTALLGNGWGAFVALGTALNFGSLFDRLLLVGCGSTFPEPAKESFRAMIGAVESEGMAGVIDTAVRRIFPESYLADHPGVIEERGDVLRATSPTAFVAACQALIDMDYTDPIGDVLNSTLVVVGDQDEATPPAMAEDLVAGMPNAARVEMRGIGHAPQLQDPNRFLETVGGFLGLDAT